MTFSFEDIVEAASQPPDPPDPPDSPAAIASAITAVLQLADIDEAAVAELDPSSREALSPLLETVARAASSVAAMETLGQRLRDELAGLTLAESFRPDRVELARDVARAAASTQESLRALLVALRGFLRTFPVAARMALLRGSAIEDPALIAWLSSG